MSDNAIVTDVIAGAIIERRTDAALNDVRAALGSADETLKASHKTLVVRKGAWVIKSNTSALKERFKIALRPGYYSAPWKNARFLEAHAIAVPKPIAYIAYKRFGIPTGYAYVSEYLSGAANVEEHARRMAAAGEMPGEFLKNLAEQVAHLSRHAYHADLSGKNILTRNGDTFWFIDMDAVRPGTPPNEEERLKNHVQLYDSFCDVWSDEWLELFIGAMWPDAPPDWFQRVKAGQAARRARIEAIWRKEGKLPRTANP